MRPILDLQPQLPFKYLRTNYLAANLGRARKAEILAGHYAYLTDLLPAQHLARLAADGVPVWRGSDAATGHEIRLKLAHPVDYEGELALDYCFEGASIYVLCFSFVPTALFGLDAGIAPLVCRIQASTRDVPLLRKVAKDVQDVAPRYGLAAALQGLALALGHGGILAVSHANQVTLKGDKAPSGSSYDEFYRSLSGGCPEQQGYFALPVPFPEKDLSEITQSHRRRTKHKRAIRQSITDAAAESMAGILLPSCRAGQAGERSPLPATPRPADTQGMLTRA